MEMENAKSEIKSPYPQEKIIFPSFQKKDRPEFSWRHWIIAFAALLVLGAGVFVEEYGSKGWSEEREERRIRKELTEGRIPDNAPFLGQVVGIHSDRITARARVSSAEERDVALYVQPNTKFYLHFRDASRSPAEVGWSEVKVGQFIVVESGEPLGERGAVAAKSVSIVE